jgi:hypothetical protein
MRYLKRPRTGGEFPRTRKGKRGKSNGENSEAERSGE